MSNEFGYIPESPEQSFGNNKGIFTPTDIYDLTRADKFTQYGQLELIQTQSITSSTNSMIFSSIQESTYNIHFITYSNFVPATANDRLGIRFFENGVEESSTVYKLANQLNRTDGTFLEINSTSSNHIRLGTNPSNGSNNCDNGYVYLYNLGDNNKFSYTTNQATGLYYTSSRYTSEFGSGALPQRSTVNQIKLLVGNNPSNNIANLQASLYGIKEYS
tara:strand:- start:8561 stop:9214 length:654 start_codon:yes stop_codon:yes gene_type:complete